MGLGLGTSGYSLGLQVESTGFRVWRFRHRFQGLEFRMQVSGSWSRVPEFKGLKI